ncbi:MAG: hypothetical protein ABIO36_02005 [Pyrinomonadaceae bacterium]
MLGERSAPKLSTKTSTQLEIEPLSDGLIAHLLPDGLLDDLSGFGDA